MNVKLLEQPQLSYGVELDLTPYNLQFLQTIVKTDEDYDLFLNDYWQQSGRQLFSILNYRQYKIKNRNLTCNDFVELYGKDKQLALEILFMQPINGIKALEDKLENGRITLEELYEKHTYAPKKHFLNFIL